MCAAEQAQGSCQGSPHVDTAEPYLRSEHVQDAVNRPSQQQPPNQEAGQHHVGEEGAEIHYLQRGQRPPVRQSPFYSRHPPSLLTAGAQEPPLISGSRTRSLEPPGTEPNPPSIWPRQEQNKLESAWLCLELVCLSRAGRAEPAVCTPKSHVPSRQFQDPL